MRVQIETGVIRFRVDESELARLLSGEVIADVTTLPDGRVLRRVVRLHAGPPRFAVDWLEWSLSLPIGQIVDHARELPSRDGIRFAIHGERCVLAIRFDVDVRDSVRMRRG